MRKQYSQIFKEHFRTSLLRARDKCRLTQEQMSPRLHLSVRSYCALESGESGCGALTLVMYLIYVCEKPQEFLDELHRDFETVVSGAA